MPKMSPERRDALRRQRGFVELAPRKPPGAEVPLPPAPRDGGHEIRRRRGFPELATDRPAAADVNLRAFDRTGVTLTYRVRGSSITIPSSTAFTTIAEKGIPKGFEGFLLAIGHDADAAAFAAITWRITVNKIAVPGFGGQAGIQWGTINSPGDVFARIGNGGIVRLEASQSSGASVTASALLVGYSWPVNNPATPVN